MNALRSTPVLAGVLAAALASFARSAAAGTVPASFVTEDTCGTRACTCDDAPMMERFRDNQMNAKAVWQTVKDDLVGGTGPRSDDDTDALFRSRFPGDPAITKQFQSCKGYDPKKNDLGKVAGVSTSGDAVVDPCFCHTFCKDMVDSIVVHEKSHRDTAIPFVAVMTGMQIGCSVLSGLKDNFSYQCDTVSPIIRTNSELVAYQAGIDSLNAAISALEESDPKNPGVACTWQPIAAPSTPAPVPTAPAGFFQRVELLWNRLIHGDGA